MRSRRQGLRAPCVSVASLAAVVMLALAASCEGLKEPTPSSPPSISSFASDASAISAGDASTLSWSMTGTRPITLTICPGIGHVSNRSRITVAPTDTVTYTLTATNRLGTDVATTTVTVTPTAGSIDVSPVWTTTGLTGDVYAVAWDRSGQLLAGGGVGGVQVWDDAAPGASWSACEGWCIVRDLAFAPTRDELLYTVWTPTFEGVEVRASRTGTLVGRFGAGGSYQALATNPSATIVAVGDREGNVTLFALDGWWREKAIIEAHAARVTSIDWNPDGSSFVSASADGTARVWDAGDGSLLRTFGESGAGARGLAGAAWAPDGSMIASVGGGNGGSNELVVWRASDGEVMTRREIPQPQHVAWSPDGATVAVAGRAPTELTVFIQGGIATHDVASSARVWQHTFDEMFSYAYGVAWHPTGERLATADKFRRVTIFDTSSGTREAVRQGDANHPGAIAWSPDGDLLVAGTREDNGVAIWTAAGRKVADLWANEGLDANRNFRVHDVAWSPDGNWIVSAHSGYGPGSKVSVWDATAYAVAYTVSTSFVAAVDWSPDSTRFATGGEDTVMIWNAADGSVEQTITGHTAPVSTCRRGVERVAWSPTGALIASAGADETVRVWNSSSGEEVLVIDDTDGRAIAWSPDGSVIATSGGPAKHVRLWDVATNRPLVAAHVDDTVVDMHWSADGTMLATVGNHLMVLDGASLALQFRGDLARSTGPSVAWSPSGEHLAIGARKPAITVWTVRPY